MQWRMEELCNKEVICVENAARLGYISDVVIDVDSGCVVRFCVTKEDGGLFRAPPPMEICWGDILKIGAETVLVKKQPTPPPAPPPKKKRLFGK